MGRLSAGRILVVVVVLLLGAIATAPNLAPPPIRETMASIGLKPLRLGLDLQGGSYLLLEVQVQEAVAERLDSLRIDMRDALSGRGGQGRRIRAESVTADETGVAVRVAAEDADEARGRIVDVVGGATAFAPGGGFTLESGGAVGVFRVTLTEDRIREIERFAVQQSIEIVRRRIDATGATQPTIQRQGARRIVVQVPGESDPQRIVELIGRTARLTLNMVDESADADRLAEGRAPPGTRILVSQRGETLAVERRPIITGDMLTGARAQASQDNPPFEVSFTLNAEGGRKFGDATRDNIGRRFAIVLDDEIVSAPVIQSWIPGGSGRITGRFDQTEATNLAILLRAGALPASLTVEERRSVGPDLGQDSIEAGEKAALVGLVAVILFVLIAYRRFGIYASIALAVNIMLIVGVLSLLQATLTLPGLAGIVLTIGMAVDANVLIFERIREESRAGKTPIQAAQTGFGQALRAIVDANVTTFIVAAILYQLGSGPVRGFAVTLAIGIGTSMFTAIVFTRVLVSQYLWGRRPKTLPSLA